MEKSEVKVGEEYGLRKSRQSESALQHVRILKHVRGKKWKAEWITPNPDLKDYVESQDIVVRWKEQKAFLRDEENERRLDEQSDRAGYVNDEGPVETALSEIFESVGDDLSFYRGVLRGPRDLFHRLFALVRLLLAQSQTPLPNPRSMRRYK